MKKPNKVKCDNCGELSNVSCTTCNRNICNDCYHCGDAGKLCGLCFDRESGYKRYRLWLSTNPRPVLSFDDWYDVNG